MPRPSIVQPFWRLANAIKEFMNLLLQAKRESDPRSQIMIFRRATLLREGMKTPNRTGNIGQRPKKCEFPKEKW
jgi:hypothetical protein